MHNTSYWTAEETLYLSPEQLDICQMKAHGKTVDDILNKHNVNEQAQLSAICYTIRGVKWLPHKETGGNFPYLSEMDTHLFKQELDANYLDMDCLRTIDGLELAFQLKQKIIIAFFFCYLQKTRANKTIYQII